MIQRFKCSNCSRESEIDNKGKNIVLVICGCGYAMEEINLGGGNGDNS